MDNTIKPIFSKPETHYKKWGKEVWITNNEEYCGKLLHFNAGAEFSSHFHVSKREHFYLLSGQVILKYKDLENGSDLLKVLEKGDVVEIPRNCPHQIRALEESVIVEISTHHEDSDSWRISQGDSQKENIENKNIQGEGGQKQSEIHNYYKEVDSRNYIMMLSHALSDTGYYNYLQRIQSSYGIAHPNYQALDYTTWKKYHSQ